MEKSEVYILKNQIHFGSLKTSVPCGTKIIIRRGEGKVIINGFDHDNLGEVDMMIRVGNIVPFVEGKTKVDASVRISPKAKRDRKYEVMKSDVDEMPEEIGIAGAKRDEPKAKAPKKMEIIREEPEMMDERGLGVIAKDREVSPAVAPAETEREILRVVNGDDFETVAKIPVKTARDAHKLELAPSGDKDAFDAVNGEQGTVVKSIGKGRAESKSVSSGKSLVAKHTDGSSRDRAAETAAARKRDAEAKRAAMLAEEAKSASATGIELPADAELASRMISEEPKAEAPAAPKADAARPAAKTASRPAESAKTAKASKAAKTASRPAKPAKAAKASKPAKAAKAAKAASKPAKPAEPAKKPVAKPAESAKPVEPVAKPAESAKPAKPAEPAKTEEK